MPPSIVDEPSVMAASALQRQSLKLAISKYHILGAQSIAVSTEQLKSTDGSFKLPGDERAKKIRKLQSAGQLSDIQDQNIGLTVQDRNSTYLETLKQELNGKKARVNALRKLIGLTDSNEAKTKSPNDALNQISELHDELEKLLNNRTRSFVRQNNEADRTDDEADPIVHSYYVLILKSRVTALQQSLEGKSYTSKGGLATLPSPPLNFSLAARHLERYIKQLSHARESTAKQINQLESDIQFERRLASELKSITKICKARIEKLDDPKGNQLHLTVPWITNTIEEKKIRAEQECKRLMACLRHVIQSHLAPYLCLHAHKLPAITAAVQSFGNSTNQNLNKLEPNYTIDSTNNINKRHKPLEPGGSLRGSAYSISNHLQPAQDDNDMSDASQISARLQFLLLSLLNQLANSSAEKICYTRVTSVNDPVVRLLLATDVVLQPPGEPHLIHLRDFGKTT